jgi:hypothetical protein
MKMNSPDERLPGRPVSVSGHSSAAEHDEQYHARTQQQRPLAMERAPQQLGAIHKQQHHPEAGQRNNELLIEL